MTTLPWLGDLDPAELRKHMGRLGLELSLAEAGQVVSALDADGDGGVSITEFLGYMKRYRTGQFERPAETPAQRAQAIRRARVSDYAPHPTPALYRAVWAQFCGWLERHALEGSRCTVRGFCRLGYHEGWVGGRSKAGATVHGGAAESWDECRTGRAPRRWREPLLLLDPGWLALHGLRHSRATAAKALLAAGGGVILMRPGIFHWWFSIRNKQGGGGAG
jgi:hypothetical protein